MAPKKILLVVLDGMSDRACPELRGSSPLQYVRKPNLDWFVDHGIAGLCDPIAPGIRCETLQTYLSLLGYDPMDSTYGQGTFDALGKGLDLQPGDVAIRCSFATVDETGQIVDPSAGGLTNGETARFVKALDGIEAGGAECTLSPGTGHRAILVIRGDGLGSNISCPYGEPVAALDDESCETADIVNSLMEQYAEALADHPLNSERIAEGKPPANILIPSGAGGYPEMESFSETHGLSSCCVAGYDLIKGICKAMDMDIYPLAEACDGTVHTNFGAKMDCAMIALQDYDFVIISYKAADVAGHMGDPKAKCDVIKMLDTTMGYLRANISDDLLIAITCGQCTPCGLGLHAGDPVPVAIYTKNCIRDDATEFSETGCSHGSIGRIRGSDFLRICMDMADRSPTPQSRIRFRLYRHRPPCRHLDLLPHGVRHPPVAVAYAYPHAAVLGGYPVHPLPEVDVPKLRHVSHSRAVTGGDAVGHHVRQGDQGVVLPSQVGHPDLHAHDRIHELRRTGRVVLRGLGVPRRYREGHQEYRHADHGIRHRKEPTVAQAHTVTPKTVANQRPEAHSVSPIHLADDLGPSTSPYWNAISPMPVPGMDTTTTTPEAEPPAMNPAMYSSARSSRRPSG
ncbi:MAG: 2,3-bisphosphoglycerate-independent phosphoglycerate mutase [Thermoplasmata archaeon]|nr:2,3-bisphosphoglycerate-independent phosphoglycerate mutase [Thermoplasmata archaeon]